MKILVHGVSRVISHPLARGSVVVLIGSTFANAAAYAYHLIVGRMLGPVQYGELASLVSFSYILNVPSIVLQTVLTKYIAGFRATKEIGRAKTLSVGAIKRLIAVIGVGALVLTPFIDRLATFLHIQAPVSVFFMYLTSALWLLTVVQSSLLQGLQLFTTAMILTNIGAILRLIGGMIGATFGVVETVFAGVVTNVLGLAAYFVPLRFVYAAKAQPTHVSRQELASYSVPSMLTILAITSLYSTDILLAKHFLPSFEAGLYAALSVMGKIIFFASSSISYVLFPVVAERTKHNTGSQRLVYTGLLAIGLVSGCITLGYFFLPRLALLLLFGQSYFPAAPFLGWFGIFLSLYSLSYLLVTTLLGGGHILVWLFVAIAAVAQTAGISMYHADIFSILIVNIAVITGLFISLLVYYHHAIKDY